MIQLPPSDRAGIEQYPVYDYNVTLTGVEFRLVQTHRERPNRWYLTIYDANGTALLSNKKMSINTPLLADLQISGLPAGEIALWDSSGAETECGFDDLGTRCLLLYFEPDEIPDSTTGNDITIEAVP